MTTNEKKPREALLLGKDKNNLVRFSYLNAEPRLNRESGKEEASVQLLIPEGSPEAKEIKDAIDRLIKATWTDKKLAVPKLMWHPLRNPKVDTKNSGKPYGPETAGYLILGAKTGDDRNTGQAIPLEMVGTTKDQDGKFIRLGVKDCVSGDYGRASISLSAYTKGTGGVSAYISRLQLVKKGEALGNGSGSAESDFDEFDNDSEDSFLD